MTFKTLASNTNTRALQKNTPISQAIPGRETEQTLNNTGGFVYKIDNWSRLDRFLILGVDGGTYYATERDITKTNLEVVIKLIHEDGIRVVDRCVEISKAGRAKDNDYALLVLACAISHGTVAVKNYAGTSLPLVARTGTHLMHFTAFANNQRGWGKVLKKSVSNWYSSKTPDQVAFQAVKYQSRDGWGQRDILRLSHPHAGDDVLRNSTYKYIVKGISGMSADDKLPAVIQAFEAAKTAEEPKLIQLITDHRLSHEMVPNERKGSPLVWQALMTSMNTTALIRNLNKMTSIGLLTPFSEATKKVITQLTDLETLRKDRIHPLTLLIARRQYATGHGLKGSLTWTPVASIIKALEDAFYLSFATVQPSGKNIMLAIDVSKSMNSFVNGASNITCREAAAVLAMVTLRTEPWAAIYGFDHKFRDLGITASDSLEVASGKTYSPNFGSTNCSLPMQFAEEQKWKVDCFVVLTDNETNQGRNHPSQALQNYRNKMGIPHAKLVSCGMTATGFTIADPADRGMLDVVGFDSNAPQFISAFAKGEL